MASSDGPKSNQCGFGMKMIISTIRGKFGNVKQLSTETLQEWLDQSKGDKPNLLLLDTRPEEEYVVSHLPGAVRVDPNEKDISSILNPVMTNTAKGRAPCLTVVCYCSIGYRSSSTAQKIQQYLNTNPEAVCGLTIEVYNLEGSLFKWANEGRHMVDGTDMTTVFAHPFNSIWGKMLDKSLRRENPA